MAPSRRKPLLSRRDPMHVHALVGVVAVVHMLWRFFLVVVHNNMRAGFCRTDWRVDFAMLALAALPNASSFFLKGVPTKKSDRPWQIWKEYRAHAAIFSMRSLAFIALILAEHCPYDGVDGPLRGVGDTNISHPWLNPFSRLLVVEGTMLLAYGVTSSYPAQPTTSIRGAYAQTPVVATALTLFQMGFTAGVLAGLAERSEIAFCWLSLCAMQLNAFNMTLLKKGFLSVRAGRVVYALLLLLGFWAVMIQPIIVSNPDAPENLLLTVTRHVLMTVGAYALRRSHVNRFLTWFLVWLADFALFHW
jgi:hypothetical protein